MSLYDFSAKTLAGQEKSLADYKGEVALVVNVASKCGLTPQYEGLEALYRAYKDRGFVVLGLFYEFLAMPKNNKKHLE